MKNLWICLLFLGWFSTSQAQEKTDSLHVEGVCKMCKERIEKYAYGKGVLLANWNISTGLLHVVYKSDKTTLIAISERIAGVGHKTNLHPADKKAYGRLPDCCQYETVEKH